MFSFPKLGGEINWMLWQSFPVRKSENQSARLRRQMRGKARAFERNGNPQPASHGRPSAVRCHQTYNLITFTDHMILICQHMCPRGQGGRCARCQTVDPHNNICRNNQSAEIRFIIRARVCERIRILTHSRLFPSTAGRASTKSPASSSQHTAKKAGMLARCIRTRMLCQTK